MISSPSKVNPPIQSTHTRSPSSSHSRTFTQSFNNSTLRCVTHTRNLTTSSGNSLSLSKRSQPLRLDKQLQKWFSLDKTPNTLIQHKLSNLRPPTIITTTTLLSFLAVLQQFSPRHRWATMEATSCVRSNHLQKNNSNHFNKRKFLLPLKSNILTQIQRWFQRRSKSRLINQQLLQQTIAVT